MKFSITIPAYKRAYLKEAIDSCLAQTYKDFELIIVNDASPEDLDSIVLAYEDKRIRYYKNEKNCGAINVVNNWNKCLDYAKGDYIICMGDDDLLLPCCLEEYVKLMEKYPRLGVYHAWTEIIDENGRFFQMTDARPEYESVYSLIWHRWRSRLQYIGDFLFDTQSLKDNGGFYNLPLAWGSDDITAFTAAITHGIANTQCLCFCYRNNRQTITKTSSVEFKLEAVNKEMSWYKSFLNIVPESGLDKKFRTDILNLSYRHFFLKKQELITEDLKGKSVVRLIFWMKRMKKYQLSKKLLFISVIKSLKIYFNCMWKRNM